MGACTILRDLALVSLMPLYLSLLTFLSWVIKASTSFRFLISNLLLFVVLVLLRGIRNRYFHPLSRFPGPFWGSVTSLYLAYMIKSIPTFGYELHQRYGKFQSL